MNYASCKYKNMKNCMKPRPLDSEFAEYCSYTVCNTSCAEQYKTGSVNLSEFGNRAQEHSCSADEIYSHTDNFQFFVIKEEYFCNYTEKRDKPSDAEYHKSVNRTYSVKSNQSARRSCTCEQNGNCNMIE